MLYGTDIKGRVFIWVPSIVQFSFTWDITFLYFLFLLNLLFKIFTLFYMLYFYMAPLMHDFSERFVGNTFSNTHIHFAKMF